VVGVDSQTFTIPNRLASYGEIIQTAENNSRARRRREEHNIQLVVWAIRKAKIKTVFGSCRVRIKWVEPTPSRKPAEVAAAAVFVQWGLHDAGIVKDPNRVIGIYSEFAVNASDPRVEVTIEGAYGGDSRAIR